MARGVNKGKGPVCFSQSRPRDYRMTLQPGFFSRNRLIPSAVTEVPRTHTRPGLSPQEREGPRRSHPGSEKEIACGVQAFRKYAAAIRPLSLCRPGLSQFQPCRCRPGSARCIGKPLQHVPRGIQEDSIGAGRSPSCARAKGRAPASFYLAHAN